MAPITLVKVHPVALFSIVDTFEHRNDGVNRVIGTLLGSVDKGVVEVTNCFCVPHTEQNDEVAMDFDYAKNSGELFKKVNPAEIIVGWYATGPDVTDHSNLIHEYYMRECNNPVHLTVDTTMQNDRMGIKAYTSTTFGIPKKTRGTMFPPCKVEIVGYAEELVGLKLAQGTKYSKQRSVKCSPDFDAVTKACREMRDMLVVVQRYVNEVIGGQKPADNEIGRALLDMVQSVPQMNTTEFEEVLNADMKDLLMVLYLSMLTKTQLAINEKLALL